MIRGDLWRRRRGFTASACVETRTSRGEGSPGTGWTGWRGDGGRDLREGLAAPRRGSGTGPGGRRRSVGPVRLQERAAASQRSEHKPQPRTQGRPRTAAHSLRRRATCALLIAGPSVRLRPYTPSRPILFAAPPALLDPAPVPCAHPHSSYPGCHVSLPPVRARPRPAPQGHSPAARSTAPRPLSGQSQQGGGGARPCP